MLRLSGLSKNNKIFSFLLSSCTGKKSVYFVLFFPVTLDAANVNPKNPPASGNSKVGKLPEMYLQTSAEAQAETSSRPSSQVVPTICRIPDRQTEWSTGGPNSVFIPVTFLHCCQPCSSGLILLLTSLKFKSLILP